MGGTDLIPRFVTTPEIITPSETTAPAASVSTKGRSGSKPCKTDFLVGTFCYKNSSAMNN